MISSLSEGKLGLDLKFVELKMDFPDMIIGIAGANASGKTMIAQSLVERYGAHSTRCSIHLAKIAKERDRPITKASLQKLSFELRQKYGEDYLIRLLEEELRTVNNRMIVVEGIRRLIDLDSLNSFADDRKLSQPDLRLKIIFVEAGLITRFNRRKLQLSAQGKSLSYEDFLELEADECEDEVAEVRSRFSPEMILNTDALDETQTIRVALKMLGLPR